MPCLDEAATVAGCVTSAALFLERTGIAGEILVVDNGSTDGSQAIAAAAGARVIQAPERGYGAALRAGIEAATGKYVVMGDADGSYDFSRLDGFVSKLREGYPLVMGNRFQGGILPGAMRPLHRYLGNPVLSFTGRLFFRTSVGDFHCGLRGFHRQSIRALALRTSGMEFATEVVVRAALSGWRIAEVPTVLAPDGRGRPSHLRTFRDGWRHLRFLLLLSPRWLFFYPGIALLATGLGLTALLHFAPLRIGTAGLDIHSMLYASAAALLGLQLCLFALFARVSAQNAQLIGVHPGVERLLQVVTLERGLVAGGALALLGFLWSAVAFWQWRETGFGALDPQIVMRDTIPAAALMVGGVEVALASFLLSVLRLGEAP